MKRVLITGASNGIGLELAYKYAQDQYNLVLVARNCEKLNQLAEDIKAKYHVDAQVIVQDLSKTGAAAEIYDRVQQLKLNIDVLINNAGFGLYGEFYKTPRTVEVEMIQVNIMALTELTKLFLPSMVENRKGHIVNIASTAAFQPGPLMSVYYATKAYVLSFSEAIENELRDKGVKVSVICPGPTETGFAEQAKLQHSKLFKDGVMSAHAVVDYSYRKLKQGETLIIPGYKNVLLSFSIRLFPRKWVTNLVRFVQEKVKVS